MKKGYFVWCPKGGPNGDGEWYGSKCDLPLTAEEMVEEISLGNCDATHYVKTFEYDPKDYDEYGIIIRGESFYTLIGDSGIRPGNRRGEKVG